MERIKLIRFLGDAITIVPKCRSVTTTYSFCIVVEGSVNLRQQCRKGEHQGVTHRSILLPHDEVLEEPQAGRLAGGEELVGRLHIGIMRQGERFGLGVTL